MTSQPARDGDVFLELFHHAVEMLLKADLAKNGKSLDELKRMVDAGLEETYYYEPPTVTWSYAVHAAIVDVDVEIGRVKIEKYVVAHDCAQGTTSDDFIHGLRQFVIFHPCI